MDHQPPVRSGRRTFLSAQTETEGRSRHPPLLPTHGTNRPAHKCKGRDSLGGQAIADRAPYGTALIFLREALASNTDDCVEWPYGRMANGYGRVKLDGFTHNAHRLMCFWKNGPAPSDKPEAAHGCGNRACVNPRHIRWASRQENMADKVIHGTDHRGERNGHAKLTESDVREIMASNEAGTVLAARYRVSSATISSIRHGRKWRHLEAA